MGHFLLFYTLTAQKIKIKKRKKNLEISSCYTCAPKIMIRWCTVPEIWWQRDWQTDRWSDRQTDRQTDERMDRWTNGWKRAQMDRWKDRWMDRWTNKWEQWHIEVSANLKINCLNLKIFENCNFPPEKSHPHLSQQPPSKNLRFGQAPPTLGVHTIP